MLLHVWVNFWSSDVEAQGRLRLAFLSSWIDHAFLVIAAAVWNDLPHQSRQSRHVCTIHACSLRPSEDSYFQPFLYPLAVMRLDRCHYYQTLLSFFCYLFTYFYLLTWHHRCFAEWYVHVTWPAWRPLPHCVDNVVAVVKQRVSTLCQMPDVPTCIIIIISKIGIILRTAEQFIRRHNA